MLFTAFRASVILCCCLLLQPAHAQNWECLKQGPAVYFTNSYAYLLGVRIDSARAVGGGSTEFQLFHTARGKYLGTRQQLDTGSGSWLGVKGVSVPGGRTYFLNYWKDTVVIEQNAGPGTSWVFYNDTTTVWYQASVTLVDTMRINGILDSVKKISIQAKQGTSNVPGSPLNKLYLLLTKTHGFEHVFELNSFPYHRPDSPGIGAFDYSLDLGTAGRYDSSGLMFARAPFSNPNYETLYDFQPGDIYQITRLGYYPLPDAVTTDSIVSRVQNATLLTYNIRRKETTMTGYGGPTGPVFTTTYANLTKTYPTGYCDLIDTTKMPEEWYSPYRYYYLEKDTGLGYHSALYLTDPVYIGPTGLVSLGEPCGVRTYYKIGLGMVRQDVCLDPYPAPGNSYKLLLTYFRKNGIDHGKYHPLRVPPAPEFSSSVILPNPAHESSTVQLPQGQTATLQVRDGLGRLVYDRSVTGRETILTGFWPSGIYFVSLRSGAKTQFQKLLIQHD